MDSSKKQKIIEKIQHYTLFDDEFMTAVFDGDVETTELLLKVIIKKNFHVDSVKTQYVIKNTFGRSVRLDIHATGEDGREADVEIQRKDDGAAPKRARYNSSLLDANNIPAGSDPEDLSESWVIFITKNDIFGADLPIYHIDRQIAETGVAFGDDAHIIYVNGEKTDETPLGRLMHDFQCENPDEMYYQQLRERTRYYKKDEKGVKKMSEIMEELFREEKEEYILGCLETGRMSVEEVARIFKMPIEKVEELKEKIKQPVLL